MHVATGCEHSCAISDTGLLYSWGHGDGGRLGHGDNNPRLVPVLVRPLQEMNVQYVTILPPCGLILCFLDLSMYIVEINSLFYWELPRKAVPQSRLKQTQV